MITDLKNLHNRVWLWLRSKFSSSDDVSGDEFNPSRRMMLLGGMAAVAVIVVGVVTGSSKAHAHYTGWRHRHGGHRRWRSRRRHSRRRSRGHSRWRSRRNLWP